MIMARRYLFRFKVQNELGMTVARGLCSPVLHSHLTLFEYIVDGCVNDSQKMTFDDFVQAVFSRQDTLIIEPCWNCDSLPIGSSTPYTKFRYHD